MVYADQPSRLPTPGSRGWASAATRSLQGIRLALLGPRPYGNEKHQGYEVDSKRHALPRNSMNLRPRIRGLAPPETAGASYAEPNVFAINVLARSRPP